VTHLLLIDDETATRLVMASRLKEAGFEVTSADSGAQGIALARDTRFDMILVDATLKSGIGGVEVVRRLRQNPKNFGVPILLSGKGSSREEFAAGYEAGADACLLKSDLPVLEHVLKVFLRKKAELDEVLGIQRTLAEQNRRMQAERSAAAVAPAKPARKPGGEAAPAPIVARPDGVLVVDDEGLVRTADRGAADLFGFEVEGRGLGKLAPSSGLEAFARDASVDPRDGLRFDLPARNGRAARSILASVVPLSSRPGEQVGERVVLLVDLAQRKVANENARLAEYTLPRQQLPALLEVARLAYGMSSLVGSSAAMSRIRNEVRELCDSAEPVLLVGEAGSGREHIARALHFCGASSGHPFLALACGGLSPENLECELFGSVRGAFEGAVDRPGALQLGKGTVFIEDIEQLPLPLQHKLLRALREAVVTRAGSERAEATEMRIVASTRVDLNQAVAAGSFDVELLRALAASVIVVPPLRERPEDLEPLVAHLLRLATAGRARLELAPAALECLRAHRWSGNVAELKAALERAARRTSGVTIELEHLPAVLRDGDAAAEDVEITPTRSARPASRPAGMPPVLSATPTQLVPAAAPAGAFGQRPGEIGADDPISLDHYERKCLERALAATGNDKLKAAKLLKVGKSTLYRKLKRYEIA
jgi:DNA-binding NtrC family response regulator